MISQSGRYELTRDFEYTSYDDADHIAILENRAAELERRLLAFAAPSPKGETEVSGVESITWGVAATRRKVPVVNTTANTLKLQVDDSELRQIAISERRWAIRRSFIEREPMATMVGAILLIALAGAVITGTFTHTEMPSVLVNTFLLLLGYFFGQKVPRTRIKRGSKTTERRG